MNKNSISLFFLIFIFLFSIYSQNLVAQEKIIFKTNNYNFISDDGKYLLEISISKKAIKDDVFYQFYLKTSSKIYLNLEKSKFNIKTYKKEIGLSKIKKSYKSNFNKDKNLWEEEIFLKCNYNDFEIFLKSQKDFLIIKTENIVIKTEIPSEIKSYILNFIDYAKDTGIDIEKKDTPLIFFSFTNVSFQSIYIFNAIFSDFNILYGSTLHIYEQGFTTNLVSGFFSFQIIFPIKFLFFSSLNLSIFYLQYPLNLTDSMDLYLFNLVGFFTGPTIRIFTIFKIIDFSLSIFPGIFVTSIYDINENYFFPILNSELILKMIGFQSKINIDFNISKNLIISLIFNSTFNFYGVMYYSIDLQTAIGF